MRRAHSPVQYDMITYPGNVVAFAGRRFGKTDAYITRIIRSMVRSPGLYWWVGLSWRSASLKRAWRITSYYARRILRALSLDDRGHINRSTFEINLPGLGEIWFRTADNPPSLAGEGVRGVVLDEFSLMQELVWTEYVQATLLDYNGWAAFAGVPKGLNWAANLYRRCAGWDGWKAVTASTYDNPFINRANIDAIRGTVSDRTFRQEYLAEIVTDGGVFRRVREAATVTPQTSATSARSYVIGVDWGRTNDATVFAVVDIAGKSLVCLDRMVQTDYNLQATRLRALHERFNRAPIVAEYNSMGGPIVEQLQRSGLPVVPFHTSNSTKAAAIDSLALAFEQGAITIVPDEVLLGELEAYESDRTASGMVTYGAPDGMHDDTVMALALAWQGQQIGGRRARSVEY